MRMNEGDFAPSATHADCSSHSLLEKLRKYSAHIRILIIRWSTTPAPHDAGAGVKWHGDTTPIGWNIAFPGTIEPKFSNWVAVVLPNAGGLHFYHAIRLPTLEELSVVTAVALAKLMEDMLEDIARELRGRMWTFEELALATTRIENLVTGAALGQTGYDAAVFVARAVPLFAASYLAIASLNSLLKGRSMAPSFA